jgi:beta-N-acetylhexosaminidase
VSPTVIGEVIRGQIGFDGLIMSDDLSMKALKGSFRERGQRAIAAGCDVLLHCNGEMDRDGGSGSGSRCAGRRCCCAREPRTRMLRKPVPFDVDEAEMLVEGLLNPAA